MEGAQMRCATMLRPCQRILFWLACFAAVALAGASARALEADDGLGLDPAGTTPAATDTTTDNLEGDVGTATGDAGLEEELLGQGFDEETDAIDLQEGRVSFALQGANVRDFCNWFAERLEINIVLSPKVDGPMNIKLKDVPWEVALRKALETHGYVLTVDENGIYTVITKEEVQGEPLKTEVYTLSYATAEKAAKIIAPLLTPDRAGVGVQYDIDSNQIIVSDVPAKQAEVERVIQKLDRQIPLVLIEVKLLEKTSTDGTDLGFKWASLESYEVGASDIVRDYEHSKTRTDRELIYTDEAWSQHLEPTRSVETRTIAGNYVTGDPELAIPLEEVIKTTTKTLILSADDFSLVFSALLREDNTELVSSPKVATVDNKEATIKVTRLIPVPHYTYNEQTGSYEISEFTDKEVGIKLRITPQVNQDDYITLDVVPELSTQFGNKDFVIGGSEISIPIIDSRQAETRVIVKSSETLVIGGLTSTDETVSVTRVPLLGNIPILGYLFRHKSTSMVKTDLLIFITPTIVSSSDEASLLNERNNSRLASEVTVDADSRTATKPPY
jgi:type IV pilus assembly protein PilQ